MPPQRQLQEKQQQQRGYNIEKNFLVTLKWEAATPPQTSRLTQHANDARLCAYATINVVRTPRQRLQQATALQLNPDEHVEHTDGRHRSAKEQKTGNGEHMCEKVVIHLAVGNEKLNVIKEGEQ